MNTMANNMAANMPNMGGPVNPQQMQQMMNNNGAIPQHQGGSRLSRASPNHSSRMQLNTYVYEYFLRFEMYDCARALLAAAPDIATKKEENGQDENGNRLGDDPMDTDAKEFDLKRPDDLPAPLTPAAAPNQSFLFEWFCLFWDLFTHKEHKVSPQIQQYLAHTQAQTRLRQEQQQHNMLRNLQRGAAEPNFAQPQQQQFNPQLMGRMANGGMMMNNKGNPLQRAAMANNQNPQAMMLQQKAAGMQRGPSDMDGNRGGPASPGSTDNAPSPSKRPRLDGGAPFNANQAAVMMQNGRPTQGMQGQQQHHGSQMPNKTMANAGGPQGQGAPMVQQGAPGSGDLAQFYNPGDLAPGNNMRPGTGAQPPTGSNHALQDYQMQLMLLEQQNKKRLMMARQEQDVGGTTMQQPNNQGGPGAPNGPGGQNFPGASPPGGRNGASPNPSEQMKRANQQMGNAGMGGSPLPDGAQSRSSPNSMPFMGQNMDPNGQHFNMAAMGMAGQINGAMRPPGAHAPGQPFTPQMAAQAQHQQQMMAAAAAHQRQQAQGGGAMQWGPNGQMPGQGPPQGTPQQRPMPPPSAPAAAGAAAGSRNATSSPQTGTAAPPTPQQASKPAPKKKDTKKNNSKAATQKKGTNIATGANPAAEPDVPQEPPTPATPITPVNPPNFAKNQNVNVNAPGVPTGQPAQAAAASAAPVPPAQHPDPSRNNFMDSGNLDFSMDFANPLTSGDVLNDFDFDSFLHDSNAGEDGNFDFNAGFMEGNEIGAE